MATGVTAKRVFGWQTDTAGCFWYRMKLPFEALPADQFTVSWGSPPPDIHDFDVVVGQRLDFPAPNGWLNLCADPSVLCVYDLDDDLLNIDPANTVPYNIYRDKREHIETNIRHADVVTVSTPELKRRLEGLNDNVVVLENCVPRFLVEGATAHAVAGQVDVGWAGSMFHAQDWDGVPEELARFARICPQPVQFHTIGANYINLPGTRSMGWGRIEDYYNNLNFALGIAPLSNSPFNGAKSWIKCLEYAARAIPVVASAVGQYPDWQLEAPGSTLLVKEMSDWVDSLMAFADQDVRIAAGQRAREAVRRWTIENQVHRWTSVYNGDF